MPHTMPPRRHSWCNVPQPLTSHSHCCMQVAIPDQVHHLHLQHAISLETQGLWQEAESAYIAGGSPSKAIAM